MEMLEVIWLFEVTAVVIPVVKSRKIALISLIFHSK